MKRKVTDNHLVKGRLTTVSPIRKPEDIKKIKKLLSNHKRELLLFKLGINNGLRCGDIILIKVRDVKHLKPGEYILIKGNKTGKTFVLMMNKSVYKVLREYLDTSGLGDDDFLFKSKIGNLPITVSSINRLIKKWCRKLNIEGSYGCETLRKTFGYHQRIKYRVSWEVLCQRFSHSSQSVTMRYLGIEDKEVKWILLKEI